MIPTTIASRAASAVAAVALIAVGACGTSPTGGIRGVSCPKPQGVVSVGEMIPSDCALERMAGGVFRIGDLVGKPAVINFWAAWCTFCVEEMPGMQKVYASFGGRVSFVGADLLGVQGETRGAARSFGRSTGVRYPLVFDTGAVLYSHFSARLVMPVTIFVKSNGRVAFRQFGPLTEAQIRTLLRTKLSVV